MKNVWVGIKLLLAFSFRNHWIFSYFSFFTQLHFSHSFAFLYFPIFTKLMSYKRRIVARIRVSHWMRNIYCGGRWGTGAFTDENQSKRYCPNDYRTDKWWKTLLPRLLFFFVPGWLLSSRQTIIDWKIRTFCSFSLVRDASSPATHASVPLRAGRRWQPEGND